MKRIYEMNKGWKAFGIVVVTILGLGAAFCAVAGIMAACHHTGFVAEIQSWQGAAKVAVDGAKAMLKF